MKKVCFLKPSKQGFKIIISNYIPLKLLQFLSFKIQQEKGGQKTCGPHINFENHSLSFPPHTFSPPFSYSTLSPIRTSITILPRQSFFLTQPKSLYNFSSLSLGFVTSQDFFKSKSKTQKIHIIYMERLDRVPLVRSNQTSSSNTIFFKKQIFLKISPTTSVK